MSIGLFIIMLNFVIAQASAAYEIINESLKEYILKDRAGLCAEADSMRPKFLKSEYQYPEFIIIREAA